MEVPEKNLLLYDWLSFSILLDKDSIIDFLGLAGCSWVGPFGSKYGYAERWQTGKGISVHCTPSFDYKHTPGVFVEMSGQGCREFETFGCIDFDSLLEWICLNHGNVTRLDVAYDDFTGVIDIQEMYRAADNYEYKCRFDRRLCVCDCPDRDPDHAGRSVCHGSRGSNVFFRCYDKRSERKAWDEVSHWVRFEVQLRKAAAMGFVSYAGSIGDKFRGVISNYLQYLVPDELDSNYRRWEVAPWWSAFLDDAAAIKLYTKKDVEYNKSRLLRYVHSQCENAVKTAILIEGYSDFCDGLPDQDELPPKYQKILSDERDLRERARLHEIEVAKKVAAGVRLAVSQGRRDEILKTICGGT